MNTYTDEEENYHPDEIDDVCKQVKETIQLLTEYIRKEFDNTMINRTPSASRDNSGSNGNRNGLEFLNVKHLNKDPQNPASKFKILWAGTPEAAGIQNRFNALVAVKLERVSSGQRYFWTLTNENPNIDTLCDNLTEDESTWHGTTLSIYFEIEGVAEKKLIHCAIDEKAQPQKARASAGKSS